VEARSWEKPDGNKEKVVEVEGADANEGRKAAMFLRMKANKHIY
jgi:hypothetical protein